MKSRKYLERGNNIKAEPTKDEIELLRKYGLKAKSPAFDNAIEQAARNLITLAEDKLKDKEAEKQKQVKDVLERIETEIAANNKLINDASEEREGDMYYYLNDGLRFARRFINEIFPDCAEPSGNKKV